MRILFIRHGDPDYEHDNLTEKGRREAALLAESAGFQHFGECFVSPMGRAQATAGYSLRKLGITAKTLDWLQEFPSHLDLNRSVELRPVYPSARIVDGVYQRCCFWDALPSHWTAHPEYLDPVHWRESPIAKAFDMPQVYDQVSAQLDQLLAERGYVKDGLFYRVERENTQTVTFFCHFGISCALLSHLWNVSPFALWFQTQLAPSSVTEVVTEERQPGIAIFRSQRIGDISHLYAGQEPPAFAGRFCEVYSNQDERH